MSPNKSGFTLIEILIALFIFTILSMLLMAGLHNVINLQGGTERNAERLRKLQMALLIVSRDIEQAVNRPITNSSGKEERAFKGSAQNITFTHGGLANPNGAVLRSSLQRTRYESHDHALWRVTWPVLDQAPTTKPQERSLLDGVDEIRFQFLDKKGHLQHDWPGEGSSDALPIAVKIILTISNWGTMSQLYVISAQQEKLSTPMSSKS